MNEKILEKFTIWNYVKNADFSIKKFRNQNNVFTHIKFQKFYSRNTPLSNIWKFLSNNEFSPPNNWMKWTNYKY